MAMASTRLGRKKGRSWGLEIGREVLGTSIASGGNLPLIFLSHLRPWGNHAYPSRELFLVSHVIFGIRSLKEKNPAHSPINWISISISSRSFLSPAQQFERARASLHTGGEEKEKGKGGKRYGSNLDSLDASSSSTVLSSFLPSFFSARSNFI